MAGVPGDHRSAAIPWTGTTVESVLSELQAQAAHNQIRHSQLAAIRFYLQSMLRTLVENWNHHALGVTNYNSLIDRIEDWRCRSGGREICLVTFNYDTLLEDALRPVHRILALSDYISHSYYKLIKLHGSVNWAHEVDSPPVSKADLTSWPANASTTRGSMQASRRTRM